MTFDEEINKYKALSYQSYGLFPIYTNEDIYKLIEELKKEYAPTILLTKNQYKEFKAGHTLEEVIARMQRLADNSSDESADGYINDDMIMRSYLHPETIEIIDDEQ